MTQAEIVKVMRRNARTLEGLRGKLTAETARRDALWRMARAEGVEMADIAAIYGVHYSRVAQITNQGSDT